MDKSLPFLSGGEFGPEVRRGLQDDVFESGLCLVGLDAAYVTEHPFRHYAVGVMVEGVHDPRVFVESAVLGVGVPAFPYRRGSLVYAVQPRWVLALQQEALGQVVHTFCAECLVQDTRAEESGAQLVTVVCDFFAQHFAGFPYGGFG